MFKGKQRNEINQILMGYFLICYASQGFFQDFVKGGEQRSSGLT